MKSRPAWNLLGSSLWLRPPGAGDAAKVRSFLARRDLLATGNAVALRTRGVLLATDPMGAPVALFRVGAGEEEAAVDFAVHADDLAHLREGLRLIAEAARSRTTLRRLAIDGMPAHAELARTLFDAGWDRRETRWIHAIDRPRAETPAETAHAR